MKKISDKAKTNMRTASIFILGVLVTIIITKISDEIVPNSPVVVKEYTDTIKIFHDYKIPQNLNNDTIRLELEKRIKNIELLNNYDEQIKERVRISKSKFGDLPNLILTNKTEKLKRKGYKYGSSSSYFSSDCPNLKNKYIDIKYDFFNASITNTIAYLQVNIYGFDDKSNSAKTFILEELYEVKPTNNMIRIDNDLAKGKYEIKYGFVLKEEANADYPTYYFKRCVLDK